MLLLTVGGQTALKFKSCWHIKPSEPQPTESAGCWRSKCLEQSWRLERICVIRQSARKAASQTPSEKSHIPLAARLVKLKTQHLQFSLSSDLNVFVFCVFNRDQNTLRHFLFKSPALSQSVKWLHVKWRRLCCKTNWSYTFYLFIWKKSGCNVSFVEGAKLWDQMPF